MEKLITGGAWTQIQVNMEGILKAVGLATGCSYDEDWSIQQANVINRLGQYLWIVKDIAALSICLYSFLRKR